MSTPHRIQKAVRQNIRRLREESGRTKSDLCRSTKIARSFWDEIESGEKTPSLATLGRVADEFSVTVEELISEPKKNKRELSRAGR